MFDEVRWWGREAVAPAWVGRGIDRLPVRLPGERHHPSGGGEPSGLALIRVRLRAGERSGVPAAWLRGACGGGASVPIGG